MNLPFPRFFTTAAALFSMVSAPAVAETAKEAVTAEVTAKETNDETNDEANDEANGEANGEAKKEPKLITLELMADHDAEAGRLTMIWTARAVKKNEAGQWIYDPEHPDPKSVRTDGPETKLELAEGAWEVQADASDGGQGRMIFQVNDDLTGTMWAVSDPGEPYPPEGEPTQWYFSADTDGPQLTGAPPMADAAEIRLETPRILREGKPIEGMSAGPDSVLEIVFQVPEGFVGKVEMSDARKFRSKPFFVIDAAKLSAEKEPRLPCPEEPGFYEIRLIDELRRRVLSHVVHLE